MPTEWKSTEIREQSCPECKNKADAAGDPMGRAVPQPGSFLVCGFCGAILRFDEKMDVRLAQEEELKLLHPIQLTLLERMQAAARELAEERKKIN